MRILIRVVLAACAIACAPPQRHSQRDDRIGAAVQLTRRCAGSPLAKWNIRGTAAGADCNVLVVDTSTVLDDASTEAIHYGTGEYGVVDGGVRRLMVERSFRGVAYRDGSGRVRTYGDVTPREAEALQPCR